MRALLRLNAGGPPVLALSAGTSTRCFQLSIQASRTAASLSRFSAHSRCQITGNQSLTDLAPASVQRLVWTGAEVKWDIRMVPSQPHQCLPRTIQPLRICALLENSAIRPPSFLPLLPGTNIVEGEAHDHLRSKCHRLYGLSKFAPVCLHCLRLFPCHYHSSRRAN
jgi:hypothetical protein